MIPAQEERSQDFNHSLLQGYNWIVVKGDPGAGKSTSLQKLVLDYATSANNSAQVAFSGIPILVPLREFTRERNKRGAGYSLLDFLYDFSDGTLSIKCSPGFFENYLEAGECLVCFDGLDEISATGHRQEVRDLIEAFARRYSRNRYLITSRIVGYEQAPLSYRLFHHFTIQPLMDLDIETYIRRWYEIREKSPQIATNAANELWEVITKNEQLKDMARRPLLLAIIAIVHRTKAELPHERVKLYDFCSEAMLTTRDAVRRLNLAENNEPFFMYRREILEAVAFWMQSELSRETPSREVLVDESNLQLYILLHLRNDPDFNLSQKEAWQQASKFISYIRDRTGILVERGEKQFAFVHLTFQEYFAASYIFRNFITDLENLRQLITEHYLEPNWREVILLLMGKLNAHPGIPTRIVEDILQQEHPYEHIFKFNLQWAASCMLDNIRLSISLQNHIVEDLLNLTQNPICLHQLKQTLDTLYSLRGLPIVESKLQTFISSNTVELRVRKNLLGLYLGDAPNWISLELERIFSDDSNSIADRAYGLANLVQTKYSESQAVAALSDLLAESNEKSLTIVARIAFQHQRFRKTLSEALITRLHLDYQRTMQALEVEPTLIVGFIVEATPKFLDFGLEAWNLVVHGLHSQLETSDNLTLLLLTNLPEFFIPHDVKSDLMSTLVAVAQNPQLNPKNANVIHWLLQLNYPPDELFELVLELDSQTDKDDWNASVMVPFFQSLLNKMRTFSYEHPQKDPDVPPPEIVWAMRIDQLSHTSLQKSFYKAVCESYGHNAAEYLKHKMGEGVFDPELACTIGRSLADQKILMADEIEQWFLPLLNQNDNAWAKGSAASYLYGSGFIEKTAALDTYLDIAKSEDVELFFRQSAAYEATKLGAVNEAKEIFEFVLEQDSSEHDEAKNAAYMALLQFTIKDTEETEQPYLL